MAISMIWCSSIALYIKKYFVVVLLSIVLVRTYSSVKSNYNHPNLSFAGDFHPNMKAIVISSERKTTATYHSRILIHNAT
jgi:inner membrane protein involved in colicin E2 resistance